MVAAPVADPIARECALVWSQRLEGEHLTEPLPETSRNILKVRLRELNAAFVSWDDDDLAAPVAEMLRPYRHQLPPNPPAYLAVLKLYLAAPVWAALKAIEQVRRGILPKSEYFPVPGHLRAIAWQVAAPFQGERIAIRRVLAARAPRREESREHRERVTARILGELRTRAGFQVGYERVAPFSSKAGLGRMASSDNALCVSHTNLTLPDF